MQIVNSAVNKYIGIAVFAAVATYMVPIASDFIHNLSVLSGNPVGDFFKASGLIDLLLYIGVFIAILKMIGVGKGK